MADGFDDLTINVGGDDEDYEKMTKKVIQETEAMAQRVEERATRMVQNVNAKVTAAGGNAGGAIPPMLPRALGPGGGGSIPSADDTMREWEARMEKMRGELGRVKQTTQQAGSFKGALGQGALDLFGLGGMSGALGGAEAVGAALTTAAAGVATFTAALTATTYAISGVEGVMNIIPNLAEGSKIALAGLTLGYIDLTAATRAFREGEMETQAIMQSGQQRAQQLIQERTDRIRGLSAEIQALKDHSESGQARFLEQLEGFLGQRGISGERADVVLERAGAEFDAARVRDLIAAHEKLAETFGMSRAELLEYKLALNNASEDEIRAARAIEARIQAVEKAKEAQREAEREERKRQHEAEAAQKRAEAEINRKQEADKQAADRIHKENMTDTERKNEELKKARDLFMKGLLSPDDYAREIRRIQQKESKEKSFEGGIEGIAAGSGAAVDAAHKERLERLQIAMQRRDPENQAEAKAQQENKALYEKMVAELQAVNKNLAGAVVLRGANLRR